MKKEAIVIFLQVHKKAVCACFAAIVVLGALMGIASCNIVQDEARANIDLESETTAEAIESVESEENSTAIEEVLDEPTGEPNATSTVVDGTSKVKAQSAENGTLPKKESTGSQSEQPTVPKKEADKPATQPKKRWVEDTERVWVVDRAAWSEQKPVFESRELCICNVCGADITANPTPHNKAHMLAGEGGGYHSEVKQVQVGSETIKHPEEGHWETRVVGGHWD